MADKKISQLTAATTPLAGTAVLPIVQNSTTKKVSVADLTAGRPVQVSTLEIPLGSASPPSIFVTGDTTTGIYASAAGAVSTAIGGQLIAEASTSSDWRVYRRGAASQYLLNSVTAAGANILASASAGKLNLGVGTTSYASISSATGDISINAGNLVQGTAAKGINFTANTPAAGMTSQLLNWYEEGTWTPTLTTTGTTFDSVTYATSTTGRYTRIGNLVYITGWIQTSAVTKTSATGSVLIGGFPFARTNSVQADASALILAEVTGFVTNHPSALEMYGTTTALLFYRSAANGATAQLTVSDIDTGSSKNSIQFSGCYRAA